MQVGPLTLRRSLIVFIGFAILSTYIAPFTLGDRRVLVPPDRDLDTIQQCFMLADGMDRLVTNPRSYYDTAILYPDRNQLRSCDPFIGFSLMGLPLRHAFRLNEVDIFELLRWLMYFVCLTYAYLLLRVAGTSVELSAAGAIVCACQPGLLMEVNRLQVISIPLILAVLYHGFKVAASPTPSPWHRFMLFVTVALYPLCGVINATVAIIGAVFLLPVLVAVAVTLWRRRQFVSFVSPVLAAIVFDAIALAPWMSDRADMDVYVGESFLAIKHWLPALVPGTRAQLPAFLLDQVGGGLVLALAITGIVAIVRKLVPGARHSAGVPGVGWMVEQPLVAVSLAVTAMAVLASRGFSRQAVPWLGWLFDAACVVSLLVYWRGQMRLIRTVDHPGRQMLMLSAGVGVFVCLVSFGPVYVSNSHAAASGITRAIFEIVPPLKAVREYERIWIFGTLFVALYATARLGVLLDGQRMLQGAAALLMAVAAIAMVPRRPLAMSAEVEAPRDFMAFARESKRHGAIYVHPYMKWNSRSGVFMDAIARELGRPIVNGYIGVSPQWFVYATSVLHRFPDPEALWLLRHWKVDTVISLEGDVVRGQVVGLEKIYEKQNVVIWELDHDVDTPHPSTPHAGEADGRSVDAAWTRRGGPTGPLDVAVPPQFSVASVEVHFAPSAVTRMPATIRIHAIENGASVTLNADRSGEWIESLAADTLVDRRWPVAAIALTHPTSAPLEVDVNGSAAPIERIVLVGK